MENPRASVVRGGDERACRCRSVRLALRTGLCGAKHGSRDFTSILQCDSADCRSTAAQKCSKRAGFFGGGDDARQKWNQFLPVWLMQMIAKHAAQTAIIARCECRRDRAGVLAAFN